MIRIPKEFVLRLIRDYSAEYQGRKYAASRRSGLMSYLVPKKDPRELGRPALRALTMIGYMDMGKTVTATLLSNILVERFKKRYGVEPVCIGGKSIVDIVEFIKDNPDILSGRSVTILFIDDMLYQGMSTERKVKGLAEKYYSDIRHKPEKLGFKEGLLILFFAGQRFKNIPPFFRSTPYLLFKGVVAQDSYEKDMIIDVLKKGKGYAESVKAQVYYGILEAAAELALDDWIEDAKRLNIVVQFRKGPHIYIQPPGVPDPRKTFIWIPFNYSGIYDTGEDEEVDAEHLTRIQKEYLLKLVAASIRIGMKIREYDIGYLSVTMLKRIARKVLGIGFPDQLLSTELIQEAWDNINKKELTRIIDGKALRPVVIE